ncbi:MAG TPA: hypothetical protein VG146_07830 [Verrucomicrobiae bacterium]|nr:hypothetical protein [Verrucomicrobiae bacterium]
MKSWPGQFVSVVQICRRAGNRRQFQENPNWAVPLLATMLDKKVVECDAYNRYRLKPPEKKRKVFMSPELKKILEKAGRTFDVDESAAGPGDPGI